MTNLNIDLAVEYVKDLVNNNKCVTCDRLNGVYVRYPCGHYICQNCVTTAEECLLCLTPPSETNYSVDKTLSLRTEHISDLLTTFQDLFNLDVFRRQRISEKLKLEKQVFPECIQAPSKYCNKRKSTLDNSVINKENIEPVYPGENISTTKIFKMENKNVYVKKWLDTNLQCQSNHRKALTDLGVNRNLNKTLARQNIHKGYNSKIKINKTLHSESENLKELSIKNKKIKKKVIPQSKLNIIQTINKNENDESGIVSDESVIVIDESQNDYIDKDMLACQAVIEAEKYIHLSEENKQNTQTSSVALKDIQITAKPEVQSMLPLHKVPFYKRSSLYENCYLCNNYTKYKKTSENNPVTIIIDSKNFVTTMNISECKEDNCYYMHKQSVGIQTDDDIQNVNVSSIHKSEIEPSKEHTINKNIKESSPISNTLKVKGIIVSESEADSETDDETVNTLETIAEVHTNASQDNKVLATMEPLQRNNRLKRKVARRGPSPLSTDSSDKENYDPNRAKRQKYNKKFKK